MSPHRRIVLRWALCGVALALGVGTVIAQDEFSSANRQRGRAAVEYRAKITTNDGKTATLSGVTVLRFAEDGLVREHRDYWAMTEPSLSAQTQRRAGRTRPLT